jgi:hypothetical protein
MSSRSSAADEFARPDKEKVLAEARSEAEAAGKEAAKALWDLGHMGLFKAIVVLKLFFARARRRKGVVAHSVAAVRAPSRPLQVAKSVEPPEDFRKGEKEIKGFDVLWKQKHEVNMGRKAKGGDEKEGAGSLSYSDVFKDIEGGALDKRTAKAVFKKVNALSKFKVTTKPTDEEWEKDKTKYTAYEKRYKEQQRALNTIRSWLQLRFIHRYWDWRELVGEHQMWYKVKKRFEDFGNEIAATDAKAWVAAMLDSTTPEARELARERRLLVRIDESRQSKDEKRQFAWLDHFTNVKGKLTNLPTSNKGSFQFYKNDEAKECMQVRPWEKNPSKDDGFRKEGKTFDFTSQNPTTYFACKVTEGEGGNQTNQIVDLQSFLKCAIKYTTYAMEDCKHERLRFVAVVDGAEGIKKMDEYLKNNEIPPECAAYVLVINCSRPKTWSWLSNEYDEPLAADGGLAGGGEDGGV